MGSYINIGLVAKEEMFMKSATDFLNSLDGFRIIKAIFPNNADYDDWECVNGNECSLETVLSNCLTYTMAYFVGTFRLGNIVLSEVDFSIEQEVGDKGLIVKIPERALPNDVDLVESIIIDFLKTLRGFDMAFCDSEAHMDDQDYSILVQYSDSPTIMYNNWKIDGLSKR